MLKMWAYHRMLLCLLGKHECNNLRDNIFFENKAVMIEYDYSEALKAEVDMGI